MLNDETLPNFVKRNHPRKEEKKKKGEGPKSGQANSPNEGGHQEGTEPLRTKPSSSCISRMKHIN
jgi:hypothetical protein